MLFRLTYHAYHQRRNKCKWFQSTCCSDWPITRMIKGGTSANGLKAHAVQTDLSCASSKAELVQVVNWRRLRLASSQIWQHMLFRLTYHAYHQNRNKCKWFKSTCCSDWPIMRIIKGGTSANDLKAHAVQTDLSCVSSKAEQVRMV